MPFKRKYPDEVLEWAKEHSTELTAKQITAEVKRLFGININEASANYYVRRYGKGIKYNPHVPVSFLKKSIGTERIDKDGYIRVIVDGGKEHLKHHIVWETRNPPVKKDEMLVFLDGDRKNCELSNLFLLKRKFITQLTWYVKQAGDITSEQRKSLILSAILAITAKEKEIAAGKNNIYRKPKKDNWRTYVELRKQGNSLKEISKKTGKTVSVIRWSLRRYDLGVYDE